MDREWMRQQLEAFADLALRYERSTGPGDYLCDPALYEQLHRAEPTVKQILRLLDPQLAEKINLDQIAGEAMARHEVHRGLGILVDMDEWAARLVPDAPTLPADQFHLGVGAGRPAVGRRGPAGRRPGCCPHRQPPTPAEAGRT
jgi:hypothetical protein